MSEHGTFSEKNERKLNMTSLLLGILAFVALAGIQWGTSQANQAKMAENQKETKSSLDSINTQITDFRTTSQKHDFLITGLTAKVGELGGSLAGNQQDDNRQWDEIRETKAKADRAVAREDFIEWKSKLERQNPTVTSPPLQNSQ